MSVSAMRRNQRLLCTGLSKRLGVIGFCCVLIACGLVNGQVAAQGLPKSPLTNILSAQKTPAVSNAPSEISFSASQTPEEKASAIDAYQREMEKRRDTAQAEHVKTLNELKNIPESSSALRQISEVRRDFYQKQWDGYAQSVDKLKDMRRLQDKLAATLKEKNAWGPPLGSPPWKLSVADDLRFAIMQAKYQGHHLEQKTALLDQEINDWKKSRSKSEVELRQMVGGKDDTNTQDNAATSTLAAEVVKRSLEDTTLKLSNALLERDLVSTAQQISALNLSNLNKTWAYYDNRFFYSDSDLKTKLTELDKKLVNLRAEEKVASIKINRILDQANTTKIKLDALERISTTPVRVLNQAKQDWRIADNLAQAARLEREKYQALTELNAILVQMWTLRHLIYTSDSGDVDFKDIKDKQVALMRRLDQGMEYLTQLIADKAQSFFELSAQLKDAQDPAERDFIKNIIKPVDEEIDHMREIYSELVRVRQTIQITEEEIQSKESSRSFGQILQVSKTVALSVGKSIWNFELIAIDDVMFVDGREVKVKRSVTIGKSLGALFILIVGFMVISRIIKSTLALAVSKGNLGVSKAVLIGRWLAVFAGIGLIITAFNLVEIPLSAFAFFGGALAIGVGFGTQNLLKNLISGVMLLIEKPIRVGDLVEVDGVTGTVTSIGIRFSTIHGAQGTDTLIPNSALVEQKLVNWTYSTLDARKEIKITVGYDSDVQQVQDILLGICNAHANVIRTPSPLVTLQDFGDNGLLFNLQCWMKIEPGFNANQVLSDLRLQILAAFNAAGIDLPYPQRLMRLDKDASIRVHMSTENK